MFVSIDIKSDDIKNLLGGLMPNKLTIGLLSLASVICSAMIGLQMSNHPSEVAEPIQTPEPLVIIEEQIVEVDTGIVPYYEQILETASDEDMYILGCVIRAEAGNQSFLGQKAVAEVVLNRVMSPKFPNTIKEVVYQKGQFSTASVLTKYPPTDMQYEVIEAVFQESEPSLPSDVFFFATYPFREVYEQIGDHYFCY